MAELLVSDKTAEKLRTVHRLEPNAVVEAVVCRSGLTFGWDHHPDRGWRALVEVEINGQPVIVVLYDANHPLGDVYHLGSAYPLHTEK